MLPIDLEAEEIEIKLARLLDRKNSERRDAPAELDGHFLHLLQSRDALNIQAPRRFPRAL
jgi:hypothetical protein